MIPKPKQYWLPVNWNANEKVRAFYTTRYAIEQKPKEIGQSDATEESDYAEFNLAMHVGDRPEKVLSNRNYLTKELGLPTNPAWLEQTHSNRVINLDESSYAENSPVGADASFTRLSDKVCCVMTADCLPILLSSLQGDWVAAVHAGWRGLASGIIENSVNQYQGPSNQLIAWLGPAISQPNFEIGAEVKEIFISANNQFESAFKPNSNGKYLADLYQIASKILAGFEIKVSTGNYCTYQQADKFYSYRRHAITGRMASLIWINN